MNIKDIKPGDFVYIGEPVTPIWRLMRAQVLQILEEDFILVRYDMVETGTFNIVATSYKENEIYPDTPEIKKLAEELESARQRVREVEGDLHKEWIDFTRDDERFGY